MTHTALLWTPLDIDEASDELVGPRFMALFCHREKNQPPAPVISQLLMILYCHKTAERNTSGLNPFPSRELL